MGIWTCETKAIRIYVCKRFYYRRAKNLGSSSVNTLWVLYSTTIIARSGGDPSSMYLSQSQIFSYLDYIHGLPPAAT